MGGVGRLFEQPMQSRGNLPKLFGSHFEKQDCPQQEHFLRRKQEEGLRREWECVNEKEPLSTPTTCELHPLLLGRSKALFNNINRSLS